jgi:hypothetical protein
MSHPMSKLKTRQFLIKSVHLKESISFQKRMKGNWDQERMTHPTNKWVRTQSAILLVVKESLRIELIVPVLGHMSPLIIKPKIKL